MTPFASESSLKSKNGYSRIIPLRTRAMGVLKSLPKTEEEFTWQCLSTLVGMTPGRYFSCA